MFHWAQNTPLIYGDDKNLLKSSVLCLFEIVKLLKLLNLYLAARILILRIDRHEFYQAKQSSLGDLVCLMMINFIKVSTKIQNLNSF